MSMRRYFQILAVAMLVLSLGACSFSSEAPDWKMKAVKAFGNYQQHYLSGDSLLASAELKRAVFYAKKAQISPRWLEFIWGNVRCIMRC